MGGRQQATSGIVSHPPPTRGGHEASDTHLGGAEEPGHPWVPRQGGAGALQAPAWPSPAAAPAPAALPPVGAPGGDDRNTHG